MRWISLGWALFFLFVSPVAGQDLGAVWNVGVGPEHCGTDPLTLAQPYTCYEATVVCPLISDRVVNLRVTEPPEGTTPRGTVIVGTGGSGKSWYEAPSHAAALLDDLNTAGYRVVQRKWATGWLSGSVSLHRAACRYATLIDWVFNRPELHTPGDEALCATGNSGGSSEIGYALTVYGMGEKLDLALMTGGPPHGVVHRGCGVGAVRWAERCNRVLDRRGICPGRAGDHSCFYSPGQIQNRLDSAFDLTGETPCADRDAPVLRRNSVLHPEAPLDYPQTSVRFLIGEGDCGSAPPLAMPYIGRVKRNTTGPFVLAVVPGARHGVAASEEGASAIFDAITEDCVPRH